MPGRKRIGNPGQQATRQGRLDEWRRAIEEGVRANRAAIDAERPRAPNAPIPRLKPKIVSPTDGPDSILVQRPRQRGTAAAKPKRGK